MTIGAGLTLAERGLLPTFVLRAGIRQLLRTRLRELERSGATEALRRDLGRGPIALETDAANEQHYTVPPEFFELVLGSHLKYSGCYWPAGINTLANAEHASLNQVCERAGLADGQEILELGCGWGSLSLEMARRFPNSRIVAVSNSPSQRGFIEARAPANLEVITADINHFDIDRQFDRVVSIEMFEHMHNYAALFERIARWVRDDGRLFVHVFCHREHVYPFETEGDDNWMGRYFFTGGVMPSLDLFCHFDDHFAIEDRWAVDGTHYARTAAAWRENIEKHTADVLRVLSTCYDDPHRWYHRWRIFFLACEELFGYREGAEWLVGHYRFAPQRVAARSPADSRLTTAV